MSRTVMMSGSRRSDIQQGWSPPWKRSCPHSREIGLPMESEDFNSDKVTVRLWELSPEAEKAVTARLIEMAIETMTNPPPEPIKRVDADDALLKFRIRQDFKERLAARINKPGFNIAIY
jgi:hypothetical protein